MDESRAPGNEDGSRRLGDAWNRMLKARTSRRTAMSAAGGGALGMVGDLLKKLDDLGIADSTIVLFLTDNGAEVFSWPDGGTTPFKSEKNSTWEGAYRIPMMARWPGHFQAGVVTNGVFSLQDWVPTLMAAVGEPDITQKLLDGYRVDGKRFKVHLDGVNQLDLLTAGKPSARSQFFYFTSDGDLAGMRYDRWKIVKLEQLAKGMSVWIEPFDELRVPRVIDLRADPFERAPEESANYYSWLLDHIFINYPVKDYLKAFYQTFARYPPRQSSGVLGRLQLLIQALEKVSD